MGDGEGICCFHFFLSVKGGTGIVDVCAWFPEWMSELVSE